YKTGGNVMKTVCCVCQKTKYRNRWVKEMHLDLKTSHGYCPQCFNKTMKEIDHYFDLQDSKLAA
ncbi:MAG: hypothetical protein KAJ60_09940, partial [Desulfobulbaceae bacterium]|nr:hypothetical protein [Desulfobulbaceae bacterium]